MLRTSSRDTGTQIPSPLPMHVADSDQPRVSVLIVNYNGRDVLGDCLRSLALRLSVPHEVIVCDNGSRDDSVAFLRREFPAVRVITSAVNAGFAAGNNLAAAEARGEFLLLLNSDTILEDDLAPVVARLEGDATIGVLGCRLAFGSGLLQESIGQDPSWWRLWASWLPFPKGFPGAALCSLNLLEGDARYDQTEVSVPWITGAMMLTRRSLWEQLGGMDAGYFMYFEDVEFCERVRQSGQRVAYTASARVTHLKSGGKPWGGRAALDSVLHSLLRFSGKHYGALPTAALRLLLPLALVARSAAYGVAALRDPGSFRGAQAAAHLSAAAWVAIGSHR